MENIELNLINEEIERPKFYYKPTFEATKEFPVYDKNGNQIGTETRITGRVLKKVWTDEEELKKQQEFEELIALEKWFNEIYDIQVKQYNRCQRLGIQYDNKCGTITQLDSQAVINAKRINTLRGKIKFL